MGIGTGIFLFVVGAILAFAIHIQQSVVSLNIVGYILMGAGIVVFIISLALTLRRRSTVSTTRTGLDANGQERIVQQETRGDGF
jgi:hypothetical protein